MGARALQHAQNMPLHVHHLPQVRDLAEILVNGDG